MKSSFSREAAFMYEVNWMKKLWVSLVVAGLLAGCQEEDNRAVSYTLPPSAEKEVVEELVRPSVIVHGVESVTNGFIVKVEERDKWLVTIASAVSHHPNALIETSGGQLLRADIEAIDEAHNIAILKFRNSAVIEPFQLAEDNLEAIAGEVGVASLTEDLSITSLTSMIQKNGEEVPVIVQPSAINKLLQQALEKPLKWQERAEISASLQHMSPLGTELKNKVDTYEKETFFYNPDQLMLTVLDFHERLVRYLATKDIKIIEGIIYSDDLVRKLDEATLSEEMGPFDLKSVSLTDTIYTVTGEVELGVGEAKKVYELSYQLVKHDDQWYVISIQFS